jgi:alkylation response protein AidB-like acyl-CoA dehydrogenase
MTKIIDRNNIDFLVFDVFKLRELLGRGRYADHDTESITSVLDLAEQIATNDLWPHLSKSDREEPVLKNGTVRIIDQAISALGVLRDAGFFSARFDTKLGGMQLPVVINNACNGMFKGANIGTMSYMGLTQAAAGLLNTYGTTDLKVRFMMPLLQGKFFGTMCLSEPNVGSSLGDIITKATPQSDGSYFVTGSKMWISGGDHNAAENIIHLVLARTPGSVNGVKGLSLFAVPKIKVNNDGSLGDNNGVSVAGLNHKMGYRGTSNCLLNFGEITDCQGHLVGELGKGLLAMFHMMNESRISVGIGGAMLANVAYRVALNYAKERKQGRKLDDKNSSNKPVAIIEHGDVRRMLMRQKALSEGAVALCLYSGMLVDLEILSADKIERQRYTDMLEVFTPIVKAWSTEFGVQANKLAIQVMGGYGYTRDFPVEQLYRDNRLNMIHEGTNGIQALDLLGRKLVMDEGRALKTFAAEIRADLASLNETTNLRPFIDKLTNILTNVEEWLTQVRSMLQSGEKSGVLTNAMPFLHAFGHLAVGWLWIKQSSIASNLLDKSSPRQSDSFLQGKITTCQYFFEYEIPEAEAWLKVVKTNPGAVLGMAEDSF